MDEFIIGQNYVFSRQQLVMKILSWDDGNLDKNHLISDIDCNTVNIYYSNFFYKK